MLTRLATWKGVPLPVLLSFLILIILILIAFFGNLLPLPNPYSQNIMESLEPPSTGHWLGTDQLGRDLLSRIVAGSHYSIIIGLGAVGIGLVGGLPFGMLAGLYGGWLDALFTRVIDVFLAFPGIIVALIVVAVLGSGLESLILAVGIRSLPVFARVARGEVLSLREREFIQGAKALGVRDYGIILRHILPNMAGSLLAISSLQMATAILISATLGFLGLGLSPEVPEWGAMMNAGRSYMLRDPQLILIPGITLMLTMMALNIFGDYIRDRSDPYAAPSKTRRNKREALEKG